ncbi:MAG TPA: site-specific integrase [Pseudonocardiaceae bacterium]|jgi:integrase|nr:site-specific integrase [Pseudonocardiaceae bacterium]
MSVHHEDQLEAVIATGPATVSGPDMQRLHRRYPPRALPSTWRATCQDRDRLLARMSELPFTDTSARRRRRRGLVSVIDWLADQPGRTWQKRWQVSGADVLGNAQWWRPFLDRLQSGSQRYGSSVSVTSNLRVSLNLLVCADVIRPSLDWLLTPFAPHHLATDMARVRDPEGFADLASRCAASGAGSTMANSVLRRAATIMAAKGGLIADITVGDCLELEALQGVGMRRTNKGGGLYAALHTMGVFGPEAPGTLRAFATQGQLSPEQMLDRYGIACEPVRQMLNEYLLERAPSVDHTTLRSLAATLGRLFWRDLEIHHPGISSLNLAPDVAAAWKQRVLVKTSRATDSSGQSIQTHQLRSDGRAQLGQVRAFYLDIAQWAMEEPARWGPWAAPCPVRREDLARVKEIRRRKSRMDQRTRERLPALPALVARVQARAQASAERLAAAQAVAAGEEFTCRGEVLHRAPVRSGPTAKTWTEDPATGARRDLSGEEDRAFWTWVAIETLRHTGIRIEELTELSHHSLIQYTPPTSTDLIPLLQIAPSKTDTERLLVISPELADVLAAVLHRIREPSGAVAAVASYDPHERIWNPPMPLLFQRRFGGGNRAIPSGTIRDWICQAIPDTTPIAGTQNNSAVQPLRFTPHDFRRIFITDAVLHGMPPHIAQLVAGHRDINTTMGYKAVYPEEAINGHRAFIARRRALRPAEEYRTPTPEEWQEFLGHFEHRKVSLGTCGRSYATACIHEHSCLRCPLLRPDPAQHQRLVDVRDNLLTRIEEARTQGWLGEVEGLQISLAGARTKLAQLDQMIPPTLRTPVDLGIPTAPTS